MTGAAPRLARLLLALAACAFAPLPAAGADDARSARMIHLLADTNVEAYRVLLGMAVQGHAPSQYRLGVVHRAGAQAVAWLGRAAARGHAGARARLARMAEAGDAAAHRALGFAWRDGTPRDARAALRHFRAAAAQGDPQALFALGALYRAGGAVAPDAARATVLFRAAAAQAMAAVRRAQREAKAGLLGPGSEAWMAFAVARTHAAHAAPPGRDAARAALFARYWIGLTLLVGAGTAADPARAIAHHRAAAGRSFSPAEFSLGLLHARGHGVPRDLAEARRWFARAAAHGHPPPAAVRAAPRSGRGGRRIVNRRDACARGARGAPAPRG